MEATEENVKTFVIPDDLCRRAGLAAAQCPINQFALFAYEKRNHRQEDKPSHFASKKSSNVYLIRQSVLLFEPILRKLVNESNGTFMHVQSLIRDKTIERRTELLKASRQYRSIIRACLLELQEDLSKQHTDKVQDYITIFYSVECIWHLCEILFIEPIQGKVVLPMLLEWVRFHFPKPERNAAQLLSGDLGGWDCHEEYWPTVFGSLLQGRVKVVRALLRQHSSADAYAYRAVDQVLRAMPVNNALNGASVNEFTVQWRHWTIDIQSKLDANIFDTEPKLNLMMRLVVGEEQAWAEIQSHCEAWYELLAGWLFYTEPTVKTYELGRFAKQCIAKMRMQNRMKHLDRLVLATLEFDVLQVIKEIQHMSENGWFVTHLSDLLLHSGRLSNFGTADQQQFDPKTVHYAFLLDYGTLLMGHKSLWTVGLTYLDQCGNDGISAIELLLPRVQPHTEAKALKIVREARHRDLAHVAASICKTEGLKALRRGRLGNALTWALKAHDGPFTSFLADKFLREYTNKGCLASGDLLDNLGSCMLASDRLIFLGKYYEFHKLYRAGDYKEAGSLLVNLLASKIIPNYFWYVLLIEAIPLLESEELVFSSNDTFQIIHCLEEKENLPELKDKIEILRLAAARNLSRALTFEAQLV